MKSAYNNAGRAYMHYHIYRDALVSFEHAISVL